MKYIIENKYILALEIFALLGSVFIIIGAILPWFTFLGGLQTFAGVSGLNGKILLGSGIVTLGIDIVFVVRKRKIFQWGLGFVGFMQTAFCGYLLINLYKIFHHLSTDATTSMMAAGIGPGLFVTTLGALLIFFTLFIPSLKETSK